MDTIASLSPEQAIRFLTAAIPAKEPILLWGKPGSGKTAVIEAAAQIIGADVLAEFAALADPTDPKGLPCASGDSARFVPMGNMKRAIDAQRLTVFDLEDLGQAPPSVQAAYMPLIFARRSGEHKISDHVCFLASTNSRADRAGVTGLLEPIKSRFSSIIRLETDLDSWVNWAFGAGIETEVIAFLRFRPEVFHDFKPSLDMSNSPCPRTWAAVSRMLALSLPDDILPAAVTGAVGDAAATEFLAFLRMFKSLPNPDRILADPDTAEVPTRPDVLYALSGALAARVTPHSASRYYRYADRLIQSAHAEFGVLMHRDAARKTEIIETRAAVEWITRNQAIL